MTPSSTEYTIESSGKKFLNLSELWRYRELFYFFTWRDIKIKYKQTFLGFLWAILQPLFMMVIFTLFFGKALAVPSQGLPYPVFVLSGFLIWNIFSVGLTGASNSMINNAQIIQKIYFPKIVIPVSSLFGALFDFAMAFLLFICILVFYKQPVMWTALLYWPLAILCAFVATLGPGCLLAALNVKYRDFRYVVPFALQVLLFITPVIYPPGLLKYEALQYIQALSPIYASIEFFRQPLTGGFSGILPLMISVSSCIIWLVVGVLFFRRTEEFFADLV